VAWDVEVTDKFEIWWNGLGEQEQVKIDASVRLLQEFGATLDHPHTSSVSQSKHSRMRELRIQIEGRPYRVLYAFDPRRVAILLLGGEKTGDDRWYQVNVPIADRLYESHVAGLKKE
jgi:hypothetical protein